MLESGAHILCVDYDREIRQDLTATFPCLRFTFANSFTSGLELIRYGLFDLYLLNDLPDQSGIELCREIRMTDTNTPVVIFSPAGHPCHQAEAFDAGANCYLDMPNELFLLESTVMGLLSRAEVRSLDARMAEIAAIRDELQSHLEQLDNRMNKNAETTISGMNHLLKARAYASFMDSGGVRSYFERLWDEVVGRSEEDL